MYFLKLLKMLQKFLINYDIEIIEAHHNNKMDAPSGTAVKAYEIIADALEKDKEENYISGRQGIVGIRTPKEIGMHAIRGGDIVGDHTVLFAGEGERIEITHRAHGRQVFIKGVIKSIKYVIRAPPGIYDMGDVLGIK